MMQVSRSEPVYLNSSFDNIALGKTWNEEVSRSLSDLAKKVLDVEEDVYDIEVERNDDFVEAINVHGSYGYFSITSKPTGYFFVTFSVKISRRDAYDYSSDSEATRRLLEALLAYAGEMTGHTIHKCVFDDASMNEMNLRAFFIEKAKPSKAH